MNAKMERKTNETSVAVELDVCGEGKYEIETDFPFFSHMLELLARYAMLDLNVKAAGDLQHHIVEDTGIVLGKALEEALGDRKGIKRFGFFVLPMDECLARVAIDFSGRPFLGLRAGFSQERVEGFETALVEEFFRAFSGSCKCTLQMDLLKGGNAHHEIETLFKCFGKALRMACEKDARFSGIPSTKGTLGGDKNG